MSGRKKINFSPKKFIKTKATFIGQRRMNMTIQERPQFNNKKCIQLQEHY
jgi:hypothetical protein